MSLVLIGSVRKTKEVLMAHENALQKQLAMMLLENSEKQYVLMLMVQPLCYRCGNVKK